MWRGAADLLRVAQGRLVKLRSTPSSSQAQAAAPAAVREALAVLAWYADHKTWRHDFPSDAALDCGRRARAALVRLDETRKGAA